MPPAMNPNSEHRLRHSVAELVLVRMVWYFHTLLPTPSLRVGQSSRALWER